MPYTIDATVILINKDKNLTNKINKICKIYRLSSVLCQSWND